MSTRTPVRLKDIAASLGVSVVTVSKVLNDHPDIGPVTRKKVLACVRKMGYRPNLTARGLVTGRSYVVGLVVPDLIHAFYSELAKGLSSVLRGKGYGLVISSSEENAELEQQEIDQMLARRVDALLLASCQLQPDKLAVIEERGTPLVLVDRRFSGAQHNFVGIDDVRAGELATQHLVDVGRKRIAHIGGPNVSPSLDRAQGYRNVLARNGIKTPDQYTTILTRGDESGHITSYHAMQKLLALPQRPDAVFCYNDPSAIGAIAATLDAGLRVPEDVAFVGCGNIPYSAYLRVPLTSVDQSAFLMGEEAAKLAMSMVAQRKVPEPRSFIMEPKLIVRTSTVATGR